MMRQSKQTKPTKPKERQVKKLDRKVKDLERREREMEGQVALGSVRPLKPSGKVPQTKIYNGLQERSKAMDRSMQDYYATLSNPMRVRGVKSPVLGNEAATVSSFAATTSLATFAAAVAANTTRQYALFPGHNTFDGDDFGVAKHSNQQTVNVTNYLVGPMNSDDGTPVVAISGVGTTCGLNTCKYFTNTASSDYPMIYDVTLPLSTKVLNTGHSRWRLVSMGVEVTNTTPVADRAGSIVTVTPDNRSTWGDGATQEIFNRFSSFTIHGTDTKVCVNWVPRTNDLGYVASGSGVSTNLFSAGLLFWLNNPTAVAQTYAIEIVFNWEIAGSNVKPLTSLSLPAQGAEEHMTKTLAVHAAHGIPIDHVALVGKAVSQHLYDGGAAIAKVARLAAERAGRAGLQALSASAKAAYLGK